MKKLKTLCMAAVALALVSGADPAAAEGQRTAKDVAFSFEGPFGTFDRGQLQRGYAVYKSVCADCHAMKFLSFRNLAEAGGPEFGEEQVKALAATFKVTDGPDENGDMFERDGVPSDKFPLPFPNEQAAKAANNGALPTDLSLITKSRAGWTGTFNQLVNGIGGPEYVYSVLTGYEEPPEDMKSEQPPGGNYNPYFFNGQWIAMPPAGTLTDDDARVEYADGTPKTVDQMSKDVAAFLAWAAEPKMEARKSTGFPVLIYLAVLALLLYLVKKKIWAKAH